MTDPFKDFLEELERRRSGGESPAADNASVDGAEEGTPPPSRPVSYTHLTLPTILRV